MGSIVATIFNTLLSPALHFVGLLLTDLTNVVVLLVLEFFRITVLKPDTTTGIWWSLLNNGYLVLAGLSATIVLASIMWEALQIQQRNVFSVGRDDSYANLIGRAIWAMLMIASGPIFLRILIDLNNLLVTTFTHLFMSSLLQSFHFHQLVQDGKSMLDFHAIGMSKQTVFNVLGATLTLDLTDTLIYFLQPFIGLLTAVLVLWAILMWFARQFELIFWGTLMPVSLALSVSDPQRKLWEFVKVQLQGLIFQQAIMGFAIWLTISVRSAVLNIGPYGVLNILFAQVFTAVGFYYAFKAPKYWQQANGHVSGGNEVAQIAAGSMLGRLGTGTLMASRGGQWLQAAGEHMTERSKRTLHDNAQSSNSFSQGFQEHVGDPLRARFAESGMGSRFNAWMETGTHNQDDEEFWEGDETTGTPSHTPPSAGHRVAARALRGVGQTVAYTSGLGADLVFNPFTVGAHRGAQAVQYHRQQAATLREENRLNTLQDEAGTDLPDLRVQGDAMEAAIQVQALENNPIAARQIQDRRNYRPPDDPAAPPPPPPSGAPRGPGGRGSHPHHPSTGPRTWTQNPSTGLYTPATPVPQQTADPNYPDLLLDTEGNILHPSYNNGDPGNTVAAAEAWNAEHDEIVQERESEAAYQAYLQQLEDSRPDESAEFPFPPHEDA